MAFAAAQLELVRVASRQVSRGCTWTLIRNLIALVKFAIDPVTFGDLKKIGLAHLD